ncbi:MAG: phosphoenolpyruvate carboxylase [Candidatus Freyarchaeum deiterrae]
MRIPATMATQDSSSATAYISFDKEIDEAIDCLSSKEEGGVGAEELVIDFSEKMTPFQQIEKVVKRLMDKGLTPSFNINITPSVPFGNYEHGFRRMAIFQKIIEVNYMLRNETNGGAIYEVILPLTEPPMELARIEMSFNILKNYILETIDAAAKLKDVQIIPNIKDLPSLLNTSNIISEYLKVYSSSRNPLDYLRILLGRSDCAVHCGLVPSTLASKIAVSDLATIDEELSTHTFPILNAGSLPFRGFVNPENLDKILNDYSGIRTITIPSSIRHDIDRRDAQKMIFLLKDKLQSQKPQTFSKKDKSEIINIIGIFTANYYESLYEILLDTRIFELVPPRRDQPTSSQNTNHQSCQTMITQLAKMCTDKEVSKQLLKMENLKIEPPVEAIPFTATLYSIGLPPEFIGTGRGLNAVNEWKSEALEKLLDVYCSSLKDSLKYASRFLCIDASQKVLPKRITEQVKEDLRQIKEFINLDANLDPSYEIVVKMISDYLSARTLSKGDIKKEGLFDIIQGEEMVEIAQKLILYAGKIRGALG